MGESVETPLAYYANNVSIIISLLQSMSDYDCTHMVYPSPAMVYGTPPDIPSPKTTCLKGCNAYANASGLPHQHQCYMPAPSTTISTSMSVPVPESLATSTSMLMPISQLWHPVQMMTITHPLLCSIKMTTLTPSLTLECTLFSQQAFPNFSKYTLT